MQTSIPFEQVTQALLNEGKPFSPRYLHRLSDLSETDLAQLAQSWPRVPDWRRKALLEDLSDLNETDYVLSFEAVGRLALRDDHAPVRQLALKLIADYELTDLIPVYLDMLEHDPDPDVRASAATNLSAFVYLGEIEELPQKTLRAIEDVLLRVADGADRILVRRRALEALGFSSREEVALLIEKAFTSRQKDWIVSALFAMGRSSQESWADKVLPMLEHSVNDIRAEAASAAGELGIKDAVPRLRELLEDDDGEVRLASVWALSQIGGEDVQSDLEDLLENTEDEDEAEFIEEALDNLAFNEEMGFFSLFDLTDLDPEDETSEPEEKLEKPKKRSTSPRK
jgi:HEAT repeat protein